MLSRETTHNNIHIPYRNANCKKCLSWNKRKPIASPSIHIQDSTSYAHDLNRNSIIICHTRDSSRSLISIEDKIRNKHLSCQVSLLTREMLISCLLAPCTQFYDKAVTFHLVSFPPFEKEITVLASFIPCS